MPPRGENIVPIEEADGLVIDGGGQRLVSRQLGADRRRFRTITLGGTQFSLRMGLTTPLSLVDNFLALIAES
jgi:hypothetical protein